MQDDFQADFPTVEATEPEDGHTSEVIESTEVKHRKEFETKIQTILEKLKSLPSTADELKITPISMDVKKVFSKLCKSLGVPVNSTLLSNINEEMLDFSYQSIGDVAIIPITKALAQCKRVNFLDLKYNKLGPKSLFAISSLLDQNESITHLNLSSNAIGKGSARFLHKLISQCHSIQVLNLSNNHLGDDELQEIGLATLKVDSIKELYLCMNDFGGAKAQPFGAYISKCSSLQKLDLSCCHLEEGAGSVFAGLKTSNLVDLNLSRNGIPNEAMSALTSGLRASKTLKFLDISFNCITKKGATILAPGLKASTTLETINLSHNPIQGPGSNALLTSVGSSLKVLDLTGIKVNLAFLKTLSNYTKTGKDIKVLFGSEIRNDCLPSDFGASKEDDLHKSNVVPFLEKMANDKGLVLRKVLKDIHAKFISEQHAALAEEGTGASINDPQERPGMPTELLARDLAASSLAIPKPLALQISELLSCEGFVDMWDLISKLKWKPDDLFVNIKVPFKSPPPAKKEKK